MKKQGKMSLTDAPIEKTLRVIEIISGIEAKRKLNSMGIHIEDRLVKLNNQKWVPVLIKNVDNGSNVLALGQGLASKIIVEYEN